jgi:dipeptidase E
MRALLGSGGFRTSERQALYAERMRKHFGDLDRILFIPWALHDHDAYLALMKEKGLDAGYELQGIHQFDDPVAAVRDADGISVGGGNTFRLIDAMHQTGVLEAVHERVHEGVPYMGVSAGTNVACPTMQTTNDMPIVQPASFKALGLIPFQINAHYFSGQTHVQIDGTYIEHFGETRDDRIREFHEMNDAPVLGLWEGGFIEVNDDAISLVGSAARMFIKGQEPHDVAPGDDLSRLTSSA